MKYVFALLCLILLIAGIACVFVGFDKNPALALGVMLLFWSQWVYDSLQQFRDS